MASQSTSHVFVFEPPEEYICTVCSKVMTEPHLTNCCGQHFCLGCLERWYQSQGFKQCPHCRSKSFEHIVNLPLKRKINELDVFCPNKGKGCQLSTKLGHLEAHLKKCDYVELTCTQGCQRKVFRKDRAEHCSHDCPKRIIFCPYCSIHGCFDNITTKHRQICPEYPVGCPRKCGEKSKQIKRKELHHHKNVCPLEPVACDLCNETMIRRKIQDHKSNLCPKRPVLCSYCNLKGPYDTVTGMHLAVCKEYPVGCPRGCSDGKQIKRKELHAHATACPLEPVQCPLSDAGCSTTIPREDLTSHMELNIQHHLKCCMTMQQKQAKAFSATNRQLASQLGQLKAKFDKLQVDHEKLQGDHDKLKGEHKSLLEEHQELKSSISAELASTEASTGAYGFTTYDFIRTILSPHLTEQNPLAFRFKPTNQEDITWISPLFTLNNFKVALKFDRKKQSFYTSDDKGTISLYLVNHKEVDGNPVDITKDIHVATSRDRSSYSYGYHNSQYYKHEFQLCKGCNRCFERLERIQSVHGEMRLVDKITVFNVSGNLLVFEITLTLQPHGCRIYD